MELSDNEVFGQDDEITTGSTPRQELSDEDVFGSAGGGASPRQAGPANEMSDEDIFGDSATVSLHPEDDPYSQAGSAAMGAAHGVVPATAGIGAGAAITGATIGSVGGPVGIGLGLLGGLGAGYIASKGQDWLLEKLGVMDKFHKAEQDNPLSYAGGEFGSAAATLRPGMSQLQAGARLFSGAVGGGAEAGMEALNGGDMDPARIAMAAGTGAALPNLNKLGNQFERIGERIGNRLFRGGNGRYRGGNDNPDLKPAEAEDPATAAPDEFEVTSLADDLPITAGGSSTVQPAAPEIPGAGNPTGAPMAAREGARPSDPTRNYGKDSMAPRDEQAPGVPSEPVVQKNSPVTDDVALALNGEQPRAQSPAGPDVRPVQEAAPTKPMFRELPPDRPAQAGQSDLSALGTNEGPIPQPRVQSDGLEGARMQREALEGVQRKQAASQEGQDFQNLPEREAPATQPDNVPARDQETSNAVPRDQSVPAREQTQNAEGSKPLTPGEMKILAESRKMLVDAGWKRALAHLDAMAPRKQFDLMQKIATEAGKEQAVTAGKTASEAVTARPGRAKGLPSAESRVKTETGTLASSKKEAARSSAAIKFATDQHAEFGPGSEGHVPSPDKQWVKDTWAEIVKRNGGVDPTVRTSTQFVPVKQTEALADAYQWLKALKAAATGQNQKNFAQLHSTKGMGTVARETGKIEGDIARRPQLPEAAEQAETATGAMEHSRETFEHMQPDPRPGKDNSYVEDHNALADYINELSPTEYSKLSDKYDLKVEMNEPADPKALHSEMLQAMADTGRRPKGEITSEVDLPAKKVDLPHLPSVEEPKPTARKLDKNSDEFKRLALQYESDANMPSSKPRDTNARLESELGANKSESRADDSSPAAVYDKMVGLAKDFASDEGGAGAKNFVKEMVLRLQKRPSRGPRAPAAGPQAAANMRGYAESFAGSVKEDMRVAEANVIHVMDDIRKLYNNAKDEVLRMGLTAKEMKAMDLAGQKDKLSTLPVEQQKFYTDMIQPLKDLHERNYKELRDLNMKYNLGLELPDPTKRGIDVQYAPRHKEGTLLWDRSADDMFDPFSNRSLAGYSRNLEARGLKALRDVGNDPTMSSMTGDRLIINVDGNSRNGFEVSIIRNGQPPFKLKNLPPSFTGDIGDVLPLKVKGKQSRWQIDHAATDEIEKATGGKVKNLEDPMSNWALAAESTTKALEQIKLRTKIMDTPEFRNLTTKNKAEAEERGYDPKFSRLKEFGDVYMPKQLKWVFDDYAKPGFGGDNAIDKLRAFNQGVAKFINVNAPLVHVWNEGVQVAVSRGHRWIWPPSYLRIGRALPEAVRSVNGQDAIQREMRMNGAHPQLAATLARGMHHDYAAMLGMDMTVNAKKWDPVAKMFNMTGPQMLDKIYKASSDVTWRLSDYMATAHYLELKAEGNTPKQATDKLNKYFSTYQVGSTILGSRGLQQFLTDPATTLFGRYKANIFQSFYHMGNGMINGTKAEKAEAFGQMITLGALGLFGFSAVDKGLEKLTGIEGIELRPRGMAAFPAAIADVAKGKKSIAGAATQAWSPAPGLQSVFDLHGNKDYKGKDIFPQGNWAEDPMIPVEGVGKLAEYAARTYMSPYSAASQHYSRDDGEGGLKGAAKGFGLEQFGISAPSERALNYNETYEKFNNRNTKARRKRPEGVIPDLINRLND